MHRGKDCKNLCKKICVRYSQWVLSSKDLKEFLYILDIHDNDMNYFSVGEKK